MNELYSDFEASFAVEMKQFIILVLSRKFNSFSLDNFVLNDTNLQNLIITLSSVSYVNFTNANLSGATITSDYIINSSFNGTDLTGAKIIGDLTGSDFTGAILNGATIASYGQDCANITTEGWLCISGHSIGPILVMLKIGFQFLKFLWHEFDWKRNN